MTNKISTDQTSYLTYGDLSVGRRVRNAYTEDRGEITSLGNGLVEITLSNTDTREEVTLTPHEVATHWRKS